MADPGECWDTTEMVSPVAEGSVCGREPQLTFFPNEILNVLLPAKYNTEHLKPEVVWRSLLTVDGCFEGDFTESSFHKRKEIDGHVLFGLFGTSKDLLAKI